MTELEEEVAAVGEALKWEKPIKGAEVLVLLDVQKKRRETERFVVN
jgi:hypothetical protein